MELEPKVLQKIEEVIAQYPEKRSAALPLLHLIQETKGYVSKKAMEWVAGKLGVEPISIYELVTFYPMLHQEKVGTQHIKVCRTLSCALKGSHEVCQHFQKAFQCPLNETTSDGNVTIEFVECLADCWKAPVVQVNETLYEEVTPEKVVGLVEQLKEELKNSKKI